MNVAITGHTSGIGKAIGEWMTARGHHVRGFSRTNGYDISNDAILDRIVKECEDIDIFFNHAYYDFQQTKLLYLLHQAWRDQRRTIVNTGTNRTQKQDYTYLDPNLIAAEYPPHYWTTKCSLDNACLFLRAITPWPRVMLIKPCGVDTPRIAKSTRKKVPVNDFADLVCSALMDPRCRIQEVSYELHPD